MAARLPSTSRRPNSHLTLQIVPLAERPEFVDQVATWGVAEWGHLNPGQTLQSPTAGLRAKTSADRIPIAFVALDKADGIVGTAPLVFDVLMDKTL